ncbi:MAG: hypothetical protein J0M15_06100 [Deltaproteobacteria bacterium]|nr:hypothetical protein [Deltaproteobacteria bacterium]
MNPRVVLIGKIFLAFLFMLFLPLGFQNCSSSFTTSQQDPSPIPVPGPTASPTAQNEVAAPPKTFNINETVLKLKSQPDLATNTSDAFFELTVSEERQEIVNELLYKLDDGKWSSTTESLQLNDLPHGNHQVQFKAISKSGTESSVLIYQWMVDLKKPKIAFSLTPQSIAGRNKVKFLYVIQEELSGIHQVSCLLNETALPNCGQDGEIILSGLSPGVQTFKVNVSDKAGNTSDLAQFSFTVNLQAPWIELTQHPEGFSNAANAIFSFSSTSIGNAITSFECKLDSAEFQTCVSPVSINIPSQGSHLFSVRGVTDDGFASEPLNYQWIFDATAPTLVIDTKDSLLQQLSFQFNGSDVNGSGIKSYECGSASEGPFSPCTSPFDGTTLFSNLHPGENRFFVKAIDNAGNVSEKVSHPFFLQEKNIPFITLNLSGGAALSSNVIPLNANKKLLRSYSKMGMGLSSSILISEAFGAPWYGGSFFVPENESGILKGIRSEVEYSNFDQVKVFSIANKSKCDTHTNKLDASGMIQKAGLRGTYIGNLGTIDSHTGVGQDFAVIEPKKPTIVENVLNFLQGKEANQHFNPSDDSTFSSIWNIPSTPSIIGSSESVFRTIVYNSLNHNAGPIGLHMGGFDYHDGTRSTGDGRDFVAGVLLGKIIKSALKMGPAFISVTTDGGNISKEDERGGTPWIADNCNNSTQLFFIVDPSKSYSYKNYFIGAFDENQTVDDSSIAANSTEKAAAIVVCNYMKFNGNKDCSSVIGNTLTKEEIVQSTILEAIFK